MFIKNFIFMHPAVRIGWAASALCFLPVRPCVRAYVAYVRAYGRAGGGIVIEFFSLSFSFTFLYACPKFALYLITERKAPIDRCFCWFLFTR